MRCFCDAIAGVAKSRHREGGGGGGGEGGDEIVNGRNEKDPARSFSFRPFAGMRSQVNRCWPNGVGVRLGRPFRLNGRAPRFSADERKLLGERTLNHYDRQIPKFKPICE